MTLYCNYLRVSYTIFYLLKARTVYLNPMLETTLRPTFQKWLIDPLLPLLQKTSPLFLTFLSGILGLIACPLIAFHYRLFALIPLILSGYLDVLDGSLARFQNTSSQKGAVFDIFTDRLVELLIILGLYLAEPASRALLTFLMLGSIFLCITSFLVVGIFTENNTSKSFHYSPGIIERAEAFLFFGAMILFPTLFTPLALLFIALVLLTTTIRLVQFSKSQKI